MYVYNTACQRDVTVPTTKQKLKRIYDCVYIDNAAGTAKRV